MSTEQLIDEYILEHISPEDEVLAELNHQTHLEVLHARMLSGHLQGQILKMLCGMIKPKRILEIGAFTGYSAICFAQGTSEDCIIDTIEIDDELETIIRSYLKKAGVEGRVNLHIGDALDVLPTLNHHYDMVFIDGDKREYSAYYNLVFDKVSSGGYILADNILWGNKVIEPLAKNDLQTKGILDFNTLMKNDSRVETAILPLRDGIFVVKKL